MLQAATGLSSLPDPVDSVRAAARDAMETLAAAGVTKADAVLVFTSWNQTGIFTPMLHEIRGICGTGTLVGCTGDGVLTQKGEVESGGAVALCAFASDSLLVRPFLVRDIKGRDDEAGREIGRMVRPGEDENALLVLFPDTLACDLEALFEGIRSVAGPVPVVGGGAATGGAIAGETFQFCGGDAGTNSVSGLVLTGRIVTTVGVTQSCLPLGKTWRVTGVVGNAIQTLDDRPAINALVESLARPGAIPASDLERIAPHLFVALPVGRIPGGASFRRGHYTVRNILGAGADDGSVVVGRMMNEGDIVSFAVRDPQGAREDLKEMIEETLAAAGKPGLGLYFNCCGRGEGLYGVAGIDSSYIGNAYPSMPFLGFFGYAEIASAAGRARLHNYSGVMTLITEAPSVSGTRQTRYHGTTE